MPLPDVLSSVKKFVNASVRVFWRGELYERRLREDYIRRLHLCGDIVASHARAMLSIPYPPPSAPGDYPHLRTSHLRDSVFADVDKVAMTVTIGTPLVYGLWLEYGIAGGRIVRTASGGVLSWIDPATGKRVFARWVRQGPIRARHWMARSIAEMQPQTTALLTAAAPNFIL
jgi:hypothetical protein